MTESEKAKLLDWLVSQRPVVAQAFFWNYSSRKERIKAIKQASELAKVAA